jgi:hypothetical protein
MKKLIFLPFLLFLITFSSCELINEVIPDVPKTVPFTYPIVIDANVPTGMTEEEFIDITQYEEYQEYSQYVTGYIVDSVTYAITDYGAPEDLYFSGEVLAWQDNENNPVTLAAVNSVGLKNVYDEGEEKIMAEEGTAYEQLVGWLDDPGSFNIKFKFGFETEEGADYVFDPEDIGSEFTLQIKFYLTIVTGF